MSFENKTLKDLEKDKFDQNEDGETVVRTTATGDFSITGLKVAGLITEVILNDSTWTALPATPLVDRNAIAIQNISDKEIKINYSDSINGYVGMKINREGERQYNITDAIPLYGKSISGDVTINVEELA